MELKVRYRDMEEVNNETDRNKEALINEINNFRNEANELKNIWQGQDADTFFNHFEYYLTKMDRIPKVYENISEFMKRANTKYEEKDYEFASNIRETVARDHI